MSDRPRRAVRVAGGFWAANARIAELAQEPARPHRPTPLPAPDPAHYQRLATSKRREADGITRHIRPGDLSNHASFALRQAKELYDQADEYEALAQGGAS